MSPEAHDPLSLAPHGRRGDTLIPSPDVTLHHHTGLSPPPLRQPRWPPTRLSHLAWPPTHLHSAKKPARLATAPPLVSLSLRIFQRLSTALRIKSKLPSPQGLVESCDLALLPSPAPSYDSRFPTFNYHLTGKIFCTENLRKPRCSPLAILKLSLSGPQTFRFLLPTWTPSKPQFPALVNKQ